MTHSPTMAELLQYSWLKIFSFWIVLNWNKEPVEKMVINGWLKISLQLSSEEGFFICRFCILLLHTWTVIMFNPSTQASLPNESQPIWEMEASQNHQHPYQAGGCCVLPSTASGVPVTRLIRESSMVWFPAPHVFRCPKTWHQNPSSSAILCYMQLSNKFTRAFTSMTLIIVSSLKSILTSYHLCLPPLWTWQSSQARCQDRKKLQSWTPRCCCATSEEG